jgi:hypothetical protein
MSDRKTRGKARDKTICLPIAEGVDYEQLVKDTVGFRAYLDSQIAEHPEVFPDSFHVILYAKAKKKTHSW